MLKTNTMQGTVAHWCLAPEDPTHVIRCRAVSGPYSRTPLLRCHASCCAAVQDLPQLEKFVMSDLFWFFVRCGWLRHPQLFRMGITLLLCAISSLLMVRAILAVYGDVQLDMFRGKLARQRNKSIS